MTDDYVDVSGFALRKRQPNEFAPDRPLIDQIAEWLDEAGLTLATLRVKGLRPAGVKINWPDIVMDREDLAWLRESDGVLPPPAADAIARLDIVLGWPAMIEDLRHRNVVNKRMIVNPYSGKYRWEWRSLGRLLGIDHKTAQAWHRQACGALAKKIGRT
ncbi:DUF6362 family protein [Acetobacter nitrogenifigens]|nr:DUF6362 family protein [Acetobacter nitrogenifigens]